jgi:hypothetical protein
MTSIFALALAALAIFVPMTVSAQNVKHQVLLSLADGDLDTSEIGNTLTAPPMRLARAWYAVSLNGANLVLDRVVTTRKSPWLTTLVQGIEPGEPVTSASPQSTTTKTFGHTLATPSSALLSFRIQLNDPSEKLLPFSVTSYSSALREPLVLHDRLNVPLQMAGQSWTLSTKSERRIDGGLLAGSLALIATNSSGQSQVLLPPAHGMAFERQELLWMGALRSDTKFDLLLKRTWVTGEIDYVLRVADAIGSVRMDPDLAASGFSSGIGATDSTTVHESRVSQSLPVPNRRQAINSTTAPTSGAFSFLDEPWNTALATAENDGLPKVLFDRQLPLGDEKVRLTFDYLPRAMGKGEESSSRFDHGFWSGPILVKVHFRGKTQVLYQAPALDGGLRMQARQINGESLIDLYISPNYNNSMSHRWVWSEEKLRFVLRSSNHSQGC